MLTDEQTQTNKQTNIPTNRPILKKQPTTLAYSCAGGNKNESFSECDKPVHGIKKALNCVAHVVKVDLY